MIETATIDALFTPEWQAAEGEDCCECGDPCYLRELCFFVKIGPEEKKTRTNIVLCQSCAELVEQIEFPPRPI